MKTSNIKFLSVTQVLAIHDLMIRRFGGSFVIRGLGLVESAVERPKATFMAAALLHAFKKSSVCGWQQKDSTDFCRYIFKKEWLGSG